MSGSWISATTWISTMSLILIQDTQASLIWSTEKDALKLRTSLFISDSKSSWLFFNAEWTSIDRFLLILLWFNLVAIKYQEFNIQTLSTRRGNTSTQSWTRCIRSTRVRSMWKLWGIWKRLASTALSSFHSWRTFQLF